MSTGPVARPYESERDLQDMQALLMEGRAGTDDWRYPHVGDLIWNLFMVLSHQRTRECVRLWHSGERLVAYAMLAEDPSFDVQVVPEYVWAGIEEEALRWVEAQLAEQGIDDRSLGSAAQADDPRRIAFLEAHGFRYRGAYPQVNMIRPLHAAVPGPQLPPGFSVRPVAPDGEVDARARAEHEVWQPYSVGNITGTDYEKLMSLPGYDRKLDLIVVTGDGTIASYSNCWVDPANRIGDFGPVGALPRFRRMGLTRALMLEGMQRMQGAGMDRVCVSTTESNAAARSLYESLGFVIVNRTLDFIR